MCSRPFEASFSGFERGPIDMVEDPDYAGRRQVPLPYDGPALFELWTTAWASADVDRSAIRLDRRCGTCGMEFWERDGDLVVPREEPADIFRVTQFPAWVLCTNAVRDLVTEHGFTNVAFEAMGEVS
jgi:hypothetical protein